jgi:hypothetical protein
MITSAVEFGPCCFCARPIAGNGPDPCRVTVETSEQGLQVWFCHAACFRERLTDPPEAPGLFEPEYF